MSHTNPTYFDGDLRRALLDAAAEAAAHQGPGSLSLRAVAREVGVSHAAPAHHFGDKTGLLTALATEGFDQLGRAVEEAAGSGEVGIDQLVDAAVAYVAFATTFRGHFEVMWRTDLLCLDDPDYLVASTGAFATLQRAVRSAQRGGWRSDGDPEELTIAAWAVVHGLAALHNSGILPMITAGRGPTELARSITSLLVNALAHGQVEPRS